MHEEPSLSSDRAAPAHHHQHKTDSGLRPTKSSGWDAQAKPIAFTLPLSAIAPAAEEEKNAGAATERVLIGRSEAIKRELAKITQPHTTFIRAPPAAPTAAETDNAATAAHSVSFAAGSAAISASASVTSLVSPRRARLLSEHKQQLPQPQQSSLVHSSSASLFTNSHHFLPLAVPSPPQPLKVPIVLLTAAAAAEATAPAAAARITHEQSQQSLAPSGSTTQLVYESETSTARLLPTDSTGSLHPAASIASLQPSGSAVSLQRYGESTAAPVSYFSSSPGVQSISHPHVAAPHPLLAVSSSLGALPYGMTVSESYATLGNHTRTSGARNPQQQSHVQSSPSMPRFGGSSAHASTSALSAAQSATALYPAELTVDNSALVQRRLRELIRENGYSYRASNNVLHGELGESSDELSDTERRRYRSSAAIAAKQRRSHSRKLIHSKTSRAPKPSWHQAGVESVAASAQAFPALFGLVDAGSALRKRKRAERLEGERARAAAHQEAARLDGTRAVTAVPTNDDDAATSTPLSPRNLSGGGGDEHSGGPPTLLRRSSNVLVPLDLAAKAVSTAVLAPAGMGARIADPLQPRPAGSKPSLIGAAVRVLLRRDLHPTTQDANAVGVRQLDRVAARDAAAAFAVKKEKKLGLMDVVAASAFGEGELTAETDQLEQTDQSAYGSTALARVYNSDAIVITPKGSEAASTTALVRAFNSASHSHAHAAAVAQRGAKRAQRVSMEKWLELRLKKHKKVLKEEDRLRARELFDMIASSSSAADRRKEDGTLMRIGERERDPLQATVELEGMRRALKGLGMDSSCEELAFRLQKLSEYHRNVRAAAASGLAVPGSSSGGSKSARSGDAGPKISSRKGAPALSSVGTVSQTGELRLAFNDFLAVYDHISNWDELLQLRHLKRHKAEQQRAQDAAQARDRRRRAGAGTGDESSGTEATDHSDATSPPRRPAAAHRHAASTSSLASPNSGSLRALHAQHQKQLASPAAAATADPSVAASAAGSRPVVPPLALDTALTASNSMVSLPSRTDETLRRVDLPFFLWVPAHHRSKKINDLITLYGLPSTVGVGVGLEADKENQGSKHNSPRKAHTARSGSKKDLRQPRSTRTHRKTAAAAADSGSDSDAAVAAARPDRDGSSSSEEDLSAPGRATPVAIERHLVDELHPTKLPAVTTAATASPPTSSPSSPLRSPGGSRSRRLSSAISSPSKKTTAGEYWGSQQVMRALHYKNLTLSSSTMQKQAVLTHETIAPGGLLSPLTSGHHRTISGSPPTSASPSSSPASLVRRPASRGVITPLPVGKRSLAPTPIPENEPFVPVPKVSEDLASPDKISAAPFVPAPSKIPELSDVAQRVAEEAERTAQEVARFVEQVRLNMQRAQAAEIAAEEQRAQEEARAKAEEEAKAQQELLSPEQCAAKEINKLKEAEAAKEAAAKDAAIQAALTLHAHVSHGEGRAQRKKKKSAAGASTSVSPVATARARAAQKAAAAAPVAATAVVPFNSTSAARSAVVQRAADLEAAAAAKDAAAAAAEAARSEVMQLTDPMIKAAKTGAWEDVLMLIQTSAGDSVRERAHYVNRKDKNGSSAIFHCVWLGHFKVLEVLLYHGGQMLAGAKPRTRTCRKLQCRSSSLTHVCLFVCICARFLLSCCMCVCPADPNVQNNRLNTALHLCCEKGHRRLIKLLIEMGAAIDLRNWQAKTCLDVIPLEEEVSLGNAVQSNTALVPVAPTTVKVASESADSLKAFVLECAADAKRKRDKEREESGGLGMVASTLSLMRNTVQSFSEMNSKRDAASAAALAAMEAKPLTLYDAEGKPLLDLFELTAEDRRSAGIRGNFFGSDRISGPGGAGGVSQSRTLGGQLLIHSAAHLSASASANAMGSYKAQYAQATSASGAAAADTRAKLVSALVREELAHHSLSSLWGKTRAAVGARQTVVASSDDLLASHETSRMDSLRSTMAQRERGIEAMGQGASRAARVEHFVQPSTAQQESQEERKIFRSETANNEAQCTIAEE